MVHLWENAGTVISTIEPVGVEPTRSTKLRPDS